MTAAEGIRRAHRELAKIIGGDTIEPLEAAVEVERLRQAWRPRNVRTILLAESHVRTSAAELRLRVRVPGHGESGYVRFVYCLGYGETSLVSPHDNLKNSGTPHYWKLFHDCIHGPKQDPAILKRVTRDTDRRIEAKMELLTAMRDAGIWLVDASVTALVGAGINVARGSQIYRNALSASWDCHVRDVLKHSNPAKVLVLGKGVDAVLQEKIKGVLPHAELCVVSQPNARMSAPQILEARRECRRFCQ